MSKGLVDLAELRKMRDKAQFRGETAYCFVQGDKIIKVYATKSDRYYTPIDRSTIPDFSVYKSDTIVFPDEYICEDGIKSGEIMDFIPDEDISISFNDETEIKPLIDHYGKAITDIKAFPNMRMVDLCWPNILYSLKNGFHIIDTTPWKLMDNTTVWNIDRFNENIVRIIFNYLKVLNPEYYDYPVMDGRFRERCLSYGIAGEELYRLIERNAFKKYNVEDLLHAYMELYLKINGIEPRNLGEIKEITKMLKKG